MNELEVRFELNNERDYNNAISYLEKSYKFKSENKQVDEYFKTKGREFENDEVGSFIYRIRQEDDNRASIFTISKHRKTYHDALENKTINLDKIDGLGFYLEIEILGDFSKEDYNNFYEKMCGEFSFLNSKIETKGYVQLMREKNGRN